MKYTIVYYLTIHSVQFELLYESSVNCVGPINTV